MIYLQRHFPKNQDLSGEWHYLPTNDPEWQRERIQERLKASPTMHLPSNWFLKGGKRYPKTAYAQPIPLDYWDPSVFGKKGQASLEDRGLDHAGTVWFTRDFNWQPGQKPAILDLDMVDYYAQVFVNGKKAGRHEGYFQQWSLDVTRLLKPGRNTITLQINAPDQIYDPGKQFPQSWPHRQNMVKGIFGFHDTRPGGTTWRGQERGTGGLIRGINMRESSGLDLSNIRVTPTKVSEQSAKLIIETTVRNWTGKTSEIQAQGEISPANFKADTRLPVTFKMKAKPGVSKIRTEVEIKNPKLWWTWDMGKPNLYNLDLGVFSKDGAELSRSRKRFGVRSVTVDKDWVWRLNGKRMYVRGSNYIGTQWLSQADDAFYRRDIALTKGANLNALRVHAHLERPEFYDQADAAGLLIWQDFPLQWTYTADKLFRKEALRQAEDMVDRFGSHPSIALWSAHNEGPNDENAGLDKAIFRKIKQLDSSRKTHLNSGIGDGHMYEGWYIGKLGSFGKNAKTVNTGFGRGDESCMSEYGAASLPEIGTLKKMFGDLKNIWPLNRRTLENLRAACFQPWTTFGVAKVKPGDSLKEFVDNNQRYQANVVRYATEAMRRNKWQGTRGSTSLFHFMFTDDAPAITWAVVDYWRKKKLGYEALKISMQPLLPSIEYDVHNPQKPVSLHVINDRHRAYPAATLQWRIKAGRKILDRGSRTMDIAPDSMMKGVSLGSLPKVTRGDATLEVLIQDRRGKELARNTLSAADFVPDPDTQVEVFPRKKYDFLFGK